MRRARHHIEETARAVPMSAVRRRPSERVEEYAAAVRRALTLRAWAVMRDEGVDDAAIARGYGTTVAEVRRGIAEARKMMREETTR